MDQQQLQHQHRFNQQKCHKEKDFKKICFPTYSCQEKKSKIEMFSMQLDVKIQHPTNNPIQYATNVLCV